MRKIADILLWESGLSGHSREGSHIPWRSLGTDRHVTRWGHYSRNILGVSAPEQIQTEWLMHNTAISSSVRVSFKLHNFVLQTTILKITWIHFPQWKNAIVYINIFLICSSIDGPLVHNLAILNSAKKLCFLLADVQFMQYCVLLLNQMAVDVWLCFHSISRHVRFCVSIMLLLWKPCSIL